MTKRNTSIHLNGKRYDALSGALLNFEEAPAPTNLVRQTQSIDGVIGGRGVKPQPTAVKKHVAVKSTAPIKVSKIATAKKTRATARHATVRRAQSSGTLMRHAVKKPATSFKQQANAKGALTHHGAGSITVVPKVSMGAVNHHRAQRAAAHSVNPRISKFGHELGVIVETAYADIQRAAHAIDDAIIVPQIVTPAAYRPDISRIRVTQSAAVTTSDIFEQALLRATSHEQLVPQQPMGKLRSLRRRMVSFTAGAVAVLAIVGLFGYQKQDTIQFKVATSQSAFAAKMPGYQPRGFSLDDVQVAGGTVNARYANDRGSYMISERQTSWGTDELVEKIALNQPLGNYSSINAGGRTVYTFGRNQAAWVYNGRLYQVAGNGLLSTQDFTQIASSM